MSKKQPLLGLCPIGKFVFSHEDALRFKAEIQQRLRRWDIAFADLEAVLPDGRQGRHLPVSGQTGVAACQETSSGRSQDCRRPEPHPIRIVMRR